MAQYLLLVRDDMTEYTKLNKNELQNIINKMTVWSDSLRKAGVYKGGQKLAEGGGKLVSRGSGVTVTDGPYAEAKELVGGFFLVETRNYDEAVSIARECPLLQYASTVEVREVTDMCESFLERANAAKA